MPKITVKSLPYWATGTVGNYTYWIASATKPIKQTKYIDGIYSKQGKK